MVLGRIACGLTVNPNHHGPVGLAYGAGEGEWKVRKHGADGRRVWRKVHLVVDADLHEIRAVEMTDHRHGDAKVI